MGVQEVISKEEREPIKGIFSTQEVKKTETGTGVRKSVQKTFWFVEELDGKIEVQPLNANYIPSGKKRFITLEDLIARFQPEPEFYVTTVFPKMQELAETVDRADTHRSNGENFTAEFEYGNALQVDEENVRANFGLGLTYLDRGETSKANNIFERLVKLDAAFDVQHKHLFNEFGISLRKNHMTKQSLEYYNRALDLSGGDDHLYYNIARAYFENKEYTPCVDYLLKAINVNPTFEVVIKFFEWLLEKNLVPENRIAEVKNAVSNTQVAGSGEPAAKSDDQLKLETPELEEDAIASPTADDVFGSDDDDDDVSAFFN